MYTYLKSHNHIHCDADCPQPYICIYLYSLYTLFYTHECTHSIHILSVIIEGNTRGGTLQDDRVIGLLVGAPRSLSGHVQFP